MELLATVKASAKAVPAMRYALALAGLAAAVALSSSFLPGMSFPSLFVVGLGAILTMAMLLVFSIAFRAGKSQGSAIIGIVFLWSVCLFVICFMAMTISAIVFGKPTAWARILGLSKNVIEVVQPAERPEVTTEMVSFPVPEPKPPKIAENGDGSPSELQTNLTPGNEPGAAVNKATHSIISRQGAVSDGPQASSTKAPRPDPVAQIRAKQVLGIREGPIIGVPCDNGKIELSSSTFLTEWNKDTNRRVALRVLMTHGIAWTTKVPAEDQLLRDLIAWRPRFSAPHSKTGHSAILARSASLLRLYLHRELTGGSVAPIIS